jgi:hypothetical protein
MIEITKEIYTGRVKWNGDHYFSGDEVKGPRVTDKTDSIMISHKWTDPFGNEWGDTVEVFEDSLKLVEEEQ